MTEPRVPATPIETAVGFDVMRAAFAVLLFRRAKRGSTEPIRVTQKERDAMGAALKPGERFRVRVALEDDLTVVAWLEVVPDDGARPGTGPMSTRTARQDVE